MNNGRCTSLEMRNLVQAQQQSEIGIDLLHIKETITMIKQSIWMVKGND
jgi:hypothetical protein